MNPGPALELPPGTYGDLTVNGGTLRLLGGDYVFCNVTTNNGSQVIAAAPSTLLVVDSFDVLPNTQISVGGSPQDLRVLVNGKHDAVNIAGGAQLALVFRGQLADGRPAPLATTTCSVGPSLNQSRGINTTVVVAQLCALGKPATLNLFSATILGTFVADEINVGDVQGGNTVPTTTTSTPTTSSTTPPTTSSSTTSTSSSTASSSTSTTSTSTTSSTALSPTSTSATSTSTTSMTSTSTSSTSSTSTSTTPPTTSSSTTSTSSSTASSSTSTTSTSTTSSTALSPTSTSPTSTSTTSTTSISTSSTSSTSTSSTSTSTTSSTSASTTSTSTSSTSTSSTETSTTSTSTTSSTAASTTTSTSSSTTFVPQTTSVPTSTSTTTSSSTSTSASAPVSTSTSTSSSTSTPSTTSTSLPPCNPLRLTSIRLKPRKGDPSKGSLKVRGVLADAGWAGVDPQQSGVDLGVQRVAGLSTCCNVAQKHWMKRGPTEFKFWDMHRTICPPLSDMRINVTRKGRATFRFFAPRIDLTPGAGPDLRLGAIVGNRCSLGSLSLSSLQEKKNGRLVYP